MPQHQEPLDLDAGSFHTQILDLTMRWRDHCASVSATPAEIKPAFKDGGQSLLDKSKRMDVPVFHLNMTQAVMQLMQFSMALIALENRDKDITLADLWGAYDPCVDICSTGIDGAMAKARPLLGDRDAAFYNEVTELLGEAETRLRRIRAEYDMVLGAAEILVSSSSAQGESGETATKQPVPRPRPGAGA